jgi:Ni/Co efflux regulator RcnB
MKRFYLTGVSIGLALAVAGAPLAMAQQAPNHDDSHGNTMQHDTQHTTVQRTTVQHSTTQRNTMQHDTMGHGQTSHTEMAPQRPMEAQHSEAPRPMQAPMQHNDMAPQGHEMSYSSHTWHNGDHYNGGRQVVGDWQSRHLRQPPPGYEWVQDGDQYVMIAITSGVIAAVIANALSQ